jgi:hypothetical protein
MLTEKQKNNIYNLPDEDLMEIIEIIFDKLAPIQPSTFVKKVYKKSRQYLPKELDSGKIKSMKIPMSNKRFPYLNIYLNDIEKQLK